MESAFSHLREELLTLDYRNRYWSSWLFFSLDFSHHFIPGKCSSILGSNQIMKNVELYSEGTNNAEGMSTSLLK